MEWGLSERCDWSNVSVMAMASKMRLFIWASMSAKWAGEVSRVALMWPMDKHLEDAGVVLGVRHDNCYWSGWEVGWLVGLVGMSGWVVLIGWVSIGNWRWEARTEVEVVVVDMELAVLVVGMSQSQVITRFSKPTWRLEQNKGRGARPVYPT